MGATPIDGRHGFVARIAAGCADLGADRAGCDPRAWRPGGGSPVADAVVRTCTGACALRRCEELAASTAAFRAIPSGDGFQTANRAQGLTASFDRSGVAIAAGSVSLQMSVRAIGSDSSSLPLGQSAPTAHGNRVSYARPQ